MDSGRRRSGRHRRRRREGRAYFEFPEDDAKPVEDPLEQRSVGLLVLFVVVVILAICVSVIMRSCEVETFPI